MRRDSIICMGYTILPNVSMVIIYRLVSFSPGKAVGRELHHSSRREQA